MPFLLRQQTDDEVASENRPNLTPTETTKPAAVASITDELNGLGEFNIYLPPSRPMLSSASEGVHPLLMSHTHIC